jgi:hypothetical protein
MQTRGRIIGALLGPVKKERLDEFRGDFLNHLSFLNS